MRSIYLQKLLDHGQKGNPLSRLDILEGSDEFRDISKPFINELSEIAPSLGTITQGQFIAPASTATSDDITDTGFTGVAMSGDGWTFTSVIWHFVAVASGVLQVGINYAGQLLAGAGNVLIDASGITITTPLTAGLVAGTKLKFGPISEMYGHVRVSPEEKRLNIDTGIGVGSAGLSTFDITVTGGSAGTGTARTTVNAGGLASLVGAYSDATDAYVEAEPVVRLPETAAPGTPESGYGYLYFKTDGKLYYKNDAGTERVLSYT